MKKRIVTAVKQRFSIRKLSIGAASVLLGTSLYFMGVSAPVVHADTIDEPAASSEKTDSSDPVSVANDSKYSDVDVNNAIDQYAEDVKTKLENNGNKVIIRPSDKQPVTVNTTKDRADQVNNIKQKIDQANQSWDAINTCKKSNNKQIKDGKDSDYFENQSLSVDDEKKSEINQITVDGKGTTLLKGQSKNIDGIDIIHTTHMTDKEREAMKVNSNNKVIVNFQPDQCSNKEITVTYNNLKNSYYLENINDETSRIKISRIDRTFSSIQAAENPKLFYGGWRGNKYDNYDPCNGPQLIIYNDPSDGFFYNNIQQISVKDTYYYDDKGEQKQIIFDTKDPAWVFVTSLNSNGGGNIEKIRALDSNDSPLSAQKIAGSTVTDHNDGWYYSDNNNNFSNANNIFGQKLDWDNNDEYNRFGFVGTAAFQYQPGMTLQYRSDDSQWGSHWACMQTQVVSSLNENVIICGHIKDETEGVAGNDTVTRTIHYLYDNGKTAKPDKTQTVSFNVTGIKDDVTGKTTWDGDAQAVDPVTTPSITGYTPDKLSIEGQDFKFGDKDVEVTVTYTANTQTAKITYIDDTTKTKLDSKDTSGKFGQTITFATAPADEIENYKKQGYVFVSNNFDNQTYQAVDSNNVFEVHFKHGIVTVTTKNPQTPNTTIDPDPHSPKYPKDISNTNSDVKRTIDYNFKDGKTAQPTVTDNLHFERTVVIDKVTGKVLSDTWTQNQDFNDIQTPTVQGYTPGRTVVSDKNIDHDHDDIVEHVVYSPDAQHMTITYIDDTTGETLHTDNPEGVSDQDSKYTTSKTIEQYKGQHYKLVSDSTKGQDLIFDHDDKVDQTYEVHFVHGTHAINQTTSPKQTIHYVYADGLARTGKVTDDNVQQLSFKRDGYNDEVTGTDHWNAWKPAQQEFVSVQSPKIDGYTADLINVPAIKVNADSGNIERTVTYKADKQMLNIVFIDNTTGAILSTVTKEGLSDESVNYNTKDDINHYKSLHYTVVSDETQGQNLVFDHDDGNDQHYEVHLVHATHKIDEQTSTKQIIHYQLADGTKVFDDYTAQVDFSRNGYNDEVTNEDHWNKWSPSDVQIFSTVVSPVKSGYRPNKASATAVAVHPGDKDIEETVIYSPDKQVMTINYIDDVTRKTLSTKQIIGVSDASANYNTKSSINSYVADHYKLVSDDTNGDNLVFDHDDSNNQVYNVHLTHTYQNVDDHKSVNETVHYVYDNGQTARPDYKAPAINFSRTGTKDLVTKDIVWNAWTPAEQSFDQVTAPSINGYTPDVEVVPSVNVSHGSDDVERTVIYHADDQTILVNYIDDDTHSTLKTDTVIGKTAQKSNYTTKKSIDGYIVDHYELVSDDTNDHELVFDSDSTKAQVYNVRLKHAHQNVSDSVSVNETIHYIYADGQTAKPDYTAPAISFKRTGDQDLVTNTIVWNAWIPASQDFNAVESPVIDGYTPSQKTISSITVKPSGKDIDQTVVYAPDTQSIIVNYIDDVTGETLVTDPLTGSSDMHTQYSTRDHINGYEKQHYVLVSDDTHGETLTFDHDDNRAQVYNVHLSHQTEPASQSRKVNETINYVYADGSKAADTVTAKPLIFTQTGVKDLVTGDIDWNGTWTSDQTFAEVKSPEITGYTASRKVVDPITVDHNSSDIYQTVIYTANDQTAKIKYIDDVTDKTLETDSANGKFGDQINFGHDVDMQIKAFEGQGYKFTSNSFNGQKYQANNSQNEFEVHFAHGTQNVSRTNKVMETIKYQFADGRQAQKDRVQTAKFTQHGVQDLVTRATVWTPSDPQNFESVTTPELEGYTPDVQTVQAVTVNFGNRDITKVVTYKANDQLAGIKYIDDTTGKTLDTEAAGGKFGTRIEFMDDPSSMIQKFEGQGYKFKSNSFNGQKYQADNSKNQFKVHFTHGTQNVVRTDKVTETVKYQFTDGRQAQKAHVQTVEFIQHGVQDLVTKTTVWTPSDPQNFESVTTPELEGYTPDVQTVPAVTVNFGDSDSTKVVTYKANAQLAGIKYIDDTTGKILDTEAASGNFGTKIEFMDDPLSMIQKFEDQGYKLVSDTFKGQAYQADNSENQFNVHFKHVEKNVSRTSTVTRTIKYVDQKTGKEIHQPVIQTLTFTENGVTDLVTGETTWTVPSDQIFNEIESPKIDGYENPDILLVDAETVKFGDGDQTVIVKYQKVETPSASYTPKTTSHSKTSNSLNTSVTTTNTISKETQNTQTALQNISIQTSQTSTLQTGNDVHASRLPQTGNKHHTNQLPQTGNKSDSELELLGFIGIAVAGLFGFGTHRKKRD